MSSGQKKKADELLIGVQMNYATDRNSKNHQFGSFDKNWGSFYFLKTNLLGPQICDTLLLSLVLFLRVNSLWSLIVNFVNIEEEETEPISNEGNVEDVPTGWALEEVGRDPFQVVQVQALRLSIITCYFAQLFFFFLDVVLKTEIYI